MLSVSEALERLRGLVSPVESERVPLAQALGRVLAEAPRAGRTQPPFAASAMDGYALRGEELEPGARFRVVGEAPAGRPWSGRIAPGEALRIFTGAPVPEGADHVVIQEDVERLPDGGIRIRESLGTGRNIRAAGFDFREGDALLSANRRIGPRDLALLAAMNLAEVSVRRRPRVAILPTGDELVQPGATKIGHGQIVASGQYGVWGIVESAGAEGLLLPIAADSLEALRTSLRAAKATGADLLILIGGASVGDHDYLRPALEAEGAELTMHKIAIRPGKPLTAARLGDLPVIGLPGNPVSAMVCSEVFLRPTLDRMTGGEGAPRPRRMGRLGAAIPANGPREHYMRAALEHGPEGAILRPYGDQDSAGQRLLAEAQALAVLAPNAPAAEPGAWVEYLPLESPFA